MENITSKGTIFGTLIAQAGPKGDTGKTGDRGLTGEAGYSPIKGVDYFTQEDISEIRKGIEGDLTGEYNKNAIEKTNIFNTNAKETTTSFDLNAENKTKEYNDNALAEIEKYNSNAIEKSNNFDTNFENKTSKFDSNYDEKTKEFNDNNDLGIQNYNNNAKKQMEIFDTNFTEKLEAFNNNAGTKFNGFNTNSDKALAEYNKNHTTKMKEFDDNYDTKAKTFDDNAAAKLDEYNKNTELKEKSFNDNAGTKTETFNSNAADKQNEFDENASDKLSEYNQNAKELINKVEQVQAENETLKAENKLIKEQIPSASASGNSVHIEDSGTLDFDWKIKGGHKQENREGYNLYDVNTLIVNQENVTVEKNETGYIIKSDDTVTPSKIGRAVIETTSLFDISKNYTFSCDITLNKAGKSEAGWVGLENTIQKDITANQKEHVVIRINSQVGTYLTLGLYTSNCVMTVENIQLVEGTEDKPYEQYGVSPSSDYPSEVETVGSDTNRFDLISYYNSANVTRATAQLLKNGIKLNFEAGADAYIGEVVSQGEILNEKCRAGCIAVKPNTTYTIQVSSAPKCYISYLDENYKAIRNFAQFFGNVTFTTDAHTHYFYLRFGYSNSTSDLTSYEFTNIKVEENLIATLYSPYGMGSVKIDVVNKNIYSTELAYGTINETTGKKTLYSSENYFACTKDSIRVNSSTKYFYQAIHHGENNWTKVFEYDIDHNFLQQKLYQVILVNSKLVFSFTTLKDTKYIDFVTVANSNISNIAPYDIVIEQDKKTSEYETHKSQTAIMPIQQEMLEGDYVADVEHHEWGKYVFTGEEDYVKSSNYSDDKYFCGYIDIGLSGLNMKQGSAAYCTHFKRFGIYSNILNEECINITIQFHVRILASHLTENSAEAFKSWLKSQYEAGTPVTIYYKLAKPLNLELTAEQKSIRDTKLYTYKNVTNIDVSDELASIDITYKKDLDLEHEKLQNQIDEIRQLISTTETSALLLDNLQKDVESEVE